MQLQVVAYDTTYPENRATAEASITVIRNPNAPTFRGEGFSHTIDEKFPLGGSVMQLSAQDEDKVGQRVHDCLCVDVYARLACRAELYVTI